MTRTIEEVEADAKHVTPDAHSNSSLTDLGICEQLYVLKHLRRLELDVDRREFPWKLWRGTTIHHFVAERLHDPTRDPIQIGLQMERSIDFGLKRFEEVPEEETLIEELHGMKRILMAYADWDLDEEANPIAQWCAPKVWTEVPYIVNWKKRSKTRLVGVLDGLGWTYDGAANVMHEHKSTSESNLRNYLSKLRSDTQMPSYAFAVQRITGRYPDGVIYTVVRNKAPSEPQFRKDGKLYSKSIATDKYTFQRDMMAAGRTIDSLEDHELQIYAEICANPPAIREYWPITQDQIEVWKAETHVKLLRAGELRRQPHRAVKNRAACKNLWGRICPFEDLCNGAWNAEQHYRPRDAHREVHEALEERPFITSLMELERGKVDP